MLRIFLAFLLLLWPAAGQAEWLEAQSPHFVVYADDSAKDIETFATRLELYHEAMAYLTKADPLPPSPSNRVTIYVVKNKRAVQKLADNKYVAGFYVPRAGGSIAVVSPVTINSDELDFSMIALLHEYAHHFLISSSAFAMPRWYAEGSAEFFSSAIYTKDGGISVGRPAYHRATDLAYGRDVTAEDLLDPDTYEKKHRKGLDAYYGKSWLLFHYLTLGNERPGQFSRYLKLMVSGKSSVEAAQEAFGDFKELDKDLDRYLQKPRIMSLRFKPGMLTPGKVTVRKLREGEAAVMPLRVMSKRGVNSESAPGVLEDARALALRYPDEPAVFAELAEAEYDAGHNAEAIAAADHALSLDPKNVNAYVQKGYALFRQAEEGDGGVEAFTAAVKPFLALNKIENDHPLPLIYFNRSLVESGRELTPIARKALERAAELAPFDLGLRFTLAVQQAGNNEFDKARVNLAPVAYNPHGGGAADRARALLERIATGKPLDEGELAALLSAAPDDDADAEGDN